MPVIADLIARALRNVDDAEALAAVKAEVAALCAKFPRLLIARRSRR